MYLSRIVIEQVKKALASKSVLLVGPRQTGKSSLIREEIKPDRIFNLLDSVTFTRVSRRPSFIRESLKDTDKLIAIDEIQKLPSLLDEVHLMIEEKGLRFLLTGSSLRKLRRNSNTNLLAGRLRSIFLHPFVSYEMKEFDLDSVLSFGSLPFIYFSNDPYENLHDYVGDYLQNEIQAEAITRNITNYSRFFTQIATSNGQVLNIEKIASDAQLAPSTVRRYLDILKDTLIVFTIEPWSGGSKRKAITHHKLYFFDCGIVSALTGMQKVSPGHPGYGSQFETFIAQELLAFRDYKKRHMDIHFWRTDDQIEVDFILQNSIAIEVKATECVSHYDLKGLKKLAEETILKRSIVVSRDPISRKIDGIDIIPYREFLKDLWEGNIV